ncbi:MAG: glycosyltransferase family 39 protein, partial [Planctomycetota bacterium]
MTMPQAADSSTSGPRTFWIGVALAVVVAGGLRVWGLNAESLDIDEVYEIRHQSVSISELANRQDSFPPLGRWLLGIWLAVGGDASARWFSLVTGLLGVVAIGLLGRCIGGDRIGVLAAWLAAISANHLLYSQQARLYGLYLLFATALMIAAWRLRTHDRWSDWLWFAVAAWLTLATHYYAALLIALLFVLVFAELSWPRRRRTMVAAGMFAVACLPLAYCLKVDLGRTKYDYLTASFDFSAWAYTYLTLVSGFTLGPPMSALRELSAAEGMRALTLWAIAICLAVGVLAWSCIQRLAWRDSLWLFTLL